MIANAIQGQSVQVFGVATDLLIIDTKQTDAVGARCWLDTSTECGDVSAIPHGTSPKDFEDYMVDGSVTQGCASTIVSRLHLDVICNTDVLPALPPASKHGKYTGKVTMDGFGELQLKTTKHSDTVVVLDTAPVTKIFTQVTAHTHARAQTQKHSKRPQRTHTRNCAICVDRAMF